jgi:hypothetical protein
LCSFHSKNQFVTAVLQYATGNAKWNYTGFIAKPASLPPCARKCNGFESGLQLSQVYCEKDFSRTKESEKAILFHPAG